MIRKLLRALGLGWHRHQWGAWEIGRGSSVPVVIRRCASCPAREVYFGPMYGSIVERGSGSAR